MFLPMVYWGADGPAASQNCCPPGICAACYEMMTDTDIQVGRRKWIRDPLVAAVLFSVVIHLALFGTYRLGRQLGWWNRQADWLVKLTQKLAAAQPRPNESQSQKQADNLPMSFLEVDPTTAVQQAPEQAKYYSTKNTVAANPEPESKPEPKVDGQQTQVTRVMENEKPKPFPLQPSAPAEPVESPAPKPKVEPGDLAMNKPPTPSTEGSADSKKGQAVTAQPERVRTLAQARERQAALTGQKVKQEGGTEHRGRLAFNAKATEFGDYDYAFIRAVEARWYYYIDNNLVTPRAGKVTCEFKLTYDGRITDMKIENNDVGEVLGMFCRNAIEDNQKYPKWPDDMRRTIGSNSREIRFTFYYN